VGIDPDYALAWAGMADSYARLGFYGFVHPQMSRPRWREAANHALAADESLAEAHSALAFGSLMYELDKAEAEHEFLRALELNPRYIQARAFYALFYLQVAAGRLPDGVEHAKLAVDADPLSGYAHSVASLTFMCADIHPRAVQSAQRAIELDSESFLPRFTLQSALYRSGQFDQAVAAGQTALAMSGRHPSAMAILALTLAAWGKTAEAEAVYSELLARARREYVLPSTLALAATAAAQGDNAMIHVREAISIHDLSALPLFPVTGSVHSYAQILASIGSSRNTG
jgi:adenylate cyclase